ncbi:MAG: HDOD domain-containing protein [Nitrosomonadales bacterium]|nr:HDOD domain-containing protein [Nitrosomonadales bacterium]
MEANSQTDLKQSVKNLNALPAMPVIAQKLLALQLDTDEGEREMLKLIGQDPQISAKLIGLANTPLFGASRKVSAVSDAAMLLGITRVKSVALGIAAMSTLTRPPIGRLDVQDLWLHSLAVALTARTIARAMPMRSRPLDDQIFLAGLLHDIGYLVLTLLDVNRSDELHARVAATPDRPLLELEQEILGITHCELGAELARQWDLPEEIIAVLRYHHTPDAEGAAISPQLICLLNIAERLQPSFGIAENFSSSISEEEWLGLGIDQEKIEGMLNQVAGQMEQAKHYASAFS